MKITDALILEHGVFRRLFDQIEARLEEVEQVPEIQRWGALLEHLLHGHGETEQDLVFAALDHLLEEHGHRDRFYQEHQEIDARFRELQAQAPLAEAKARLRSALQASRKHFRFEEEYLFPLVESQLSSDALRDLARCLSEDRVSLAGR